MNLNNRHFPYPFLSSATDDYNNKKFLINVQPSLSDSGWNLDIKIDLEDEDLRRYISNNNAFYHFVFDCRTTGYRKIIRSNEINKNIQVEIPSLSIKKKLYVFCYVVANEDFDLFSKNFNKDYGGKKFQIKKSELIAEADYVEFDDPDIDDPLERLESLIKVHKQPLLEEKSYAYTGLQGDYIIVYLNEEDYKNYIRLKGPEEDPFLWCILLIPSLMKAVDEVINENPTCQGSKWYRKLESRIYEVDKQYEDLDKEEWDAFEISQRILENQIGKAMRLRFESRIDFSED